MAPCTRRVAIWLYAGCARAWHPDWVEVPKTFTRRIESMTCSRVSGGCPAVGAGQRLGAVVTRLIGWAWGLPGPAGARLQLARRLPAPLAAPAPLAVGPSCPRVGALRGRDLVRDGDLFFNFFKWARVGGLRRKGLRRMELRVRGISSISQSFRSRWGKRGGFPRAVEKGGGGRS